MTDKEAARLVQLESMLRRAHAAIRCDDNERVARGEQPRWPTLDQEIEMTLQHYDVAAIADALRRSNATS